MNQQICVCVLPLQGTESNCLSEETHNLHTGDGSTNYVRWSIVIVFNLNCVKMLVGDWNLL